MTASPQVNRSRTLGDETSRCHSLADVMLTARVLRILLRSMDNAAEAGNGLRREVASPKSDYTDGLNMLLWMGIACVQCAQIFDIGHSYSSS